MITLFAQTTVDAAAITVETFGICVAAGIGTWVIPITILAIFRVAKKATNTGGSSL